MPRNIKTSNGSVVADAILNDGATAQAVWDALPITKQVSTRSDKVHFEILIQAGLETEARTGQRGGVGLLASWTRLLHLLWSDASQCR